MLTPANEGVIKKKMLIQLNNVQWDIVSLSRYRPLVNAVVFYTLSKLHSFFTVSGPSVAKVPN